MINLMIADDHAVVREGLKTYFSLDDRFQIISESENGCQCIDALSNALPDLLILDFHMPQMNGLEVLEKLKTNLCWQNMKILFYTGFENENVFMRAVQLGVDGYVLKSSNLIELKNAILCIMDGTNYYPEDMLALTEHTDLETDFEKISSLTNREIDVLKNLSLGMYNKEIALKLGISERTVKNHISNIFKKIRVSDRTQAAVFAIRNDLVDIYHK